MAAQFFQDIGTILDRSCAPWPSEPERWILAFSGGGDSLALALHLRSLLHDRRVELELATVDHGLDPGSTERAYQALDLARKLGLGFASVDARQTVRSLRGLGPEQAARAARYRALEEHRVSRGATRVLTAHHADDLAETVLIRMLRGTGIRGLGAMTLRSGTLWRPALLLRRKELRAILAPLGWSPVEDPTNSDPRQPRARIRLWLEQQASAGDALVEALCRLASQAQQTREVLSRLLEAGVPELARVPHGIALTRLFSLPPKVQNEVLSEMWRRVTGDPSAPGPGRLERILRSLQASGSGSWSLGRWRWVVRSHRLFLEPHAIQTPRFAYSVKVPGRWTLAALGTDLVLRWGHPDELWIHEGHPKRAALGVPQEALGTLAVRNLQPGDRIQPIGVPFRKRVSDLLRDRRVPLAERLSWPVLVVENRVAWVPGVAIEQAFRVQQGVPTLVAELEGFPRPSFLEKELS